MAFFKSLSGKIRYLLAVTLYKKGSTRQPAAVDSFDCAPL